MFTRIISGALMSFISVTPDEWDFAKNQLADASSGTKMGHGTLPASFSSKHSFIKVNGKIYCIAKGKSRDPVLEQGTMAKAKYAQDEQGNLFIIKIDNTKVSKAEQKESAILLDLSIGVGTDVRTDKNKQYTVLKYLGKNLHGMTKDQSAFLTEDKSMDLAIKFAYQVYGLHHGLLSVTKTAYAHNDIKPDNVTVDEKGNVHLIDFGLSTLNPHEKSSVHTGAYYHTAYVGAKTLTGAELDVIALKRSLFMPQQFYSHRGHVVVDPVAYCERTSLLNQSMLNRYNLNEFINTFSADGDIPDYSTQVMDSLTICAALINTKKQLGIKNSELRSNPLLCHAIVGVYFSTFPNRLKEIITNKSAYKIAGALHLDNNIEHYEQLQKDKELSGKIRQCQDTTTAFALLKLNQLKQSNYYDLIKNSHSTAQIIEKLAKQNRSELISELLKHHSAALVDVLLFASQNGLENRYAAMINNDELVAAIKSLPEDYNRQRFIDLMKNPEISDKQIITFCQDKNIRTAIDILYDNDPYNIHLNKDKKINVISKILDDNEISTAINNFHQLAIDKYYLYEMVALENGCRAFNVLFDAKITSQEEVIKTVSRFGCSEVVLLLNERGWNTCIPLAFDKNIDEFSFKVLLKSKNANQLTEQMFLNEGMRKALLENTYSDENILGLIALFNNNLFTEKRYALLKGNHSLFKQVINMIGAGFSSCINENTLSDNTKSSEEFMLNVVAYNYQALSSADDSLKSDSKFMLAAITKNVKALAYAHDTLKSDIQFMTKAVMINHQAFNYASDSLKNDPAVKDKIKRTVLNYEYANKNTSRYHLFQAHFNDQDPLKEKYKNKTGDALKTAILKEFKHSLEGKNEEERNELVKTFKSGAEYKILCTSQGIASSFFRIQTSSAHAVEKIIENANEMDKKNSFGNKF